MEQRKPLLHPQTKTSETLNHRRSAATKSTKTKTRIPHQHKGRANPEEPTVNNNDKSHSKHKTLTYGHRGNPSESLHKSQPNRRLVGRKRASVVRLSKIQIRRKEREGCSGAFLSDTLRSNRRGVDPFYLTYGERGKAKSSGKEESQTREETTAGHTQESWPEEKRYDAQTRSRRQYRALKEQATVKISVASLFTLWALNNIILAPMNTNLPLNWKNTLIGFAQNNDHNDQLIPTQCMTNILVFLDTKYRKENPLFGLSELRFFRHPLSKFILNLKLYYAFANSDNLPTWMWLSLKKQRNKPCRAVNVNVVHALSSFALYSNGVRHDAALRFMNCSDLDPGGKVKMLHRDTSLLDQLSINLDHKQDKKLQFVDIIRIITLNCCVFTDSVEVNSIEQRSFTSWRLGSKQSNKQWYPPKKKKNWNVNGVTQIIPPLRKKLCHDQTDEQTSYLTQILINNNSVHAEEAKHRGSLSSVPHFDDQILILNEQSKQFVDWLANAHRHLCHHLCCSTSGDTSALAGGLC